MSLNPYCSPLRDTLGEDLTPSNTMYPKWVVPFWKCHTHPKQSMGVPGPTSDLKIFQTMGDWRHLQKPKVLAVSKSVS